MLFRRNLGDEERVWVDRGSDGRVDDFAICPPCNESLLADDPRGSRWHDGAELCSDCRANFLARALAVDLFGLPRPLNGMLEDRVLTNDELAANPASAIPGAFDYFLPGAGDALLADEGDPSLPGPGTYFLPGIEDYLLPE